VNVDKLTRDDRVVGGLALLLVIDLLFLPWFEVSVGPFSASFTATDTPDGWLGILAVLAALALMADLLIERFSPQTQLPSLGGGRGQTRFMLACLTALFVALKFLFHIHFSLFGFGFWAAAVLTVALVWMAHQVRGSGIGVAGGV
jgi:polyferredoxin